MPSLQEGRYRDARKPYQPIEALAKGAACAP